MKNSIVLLSVVLSVVICGCDAQDSHLALREKYPTEEIANVPGEKYKYLVRTTNDDIVYVEYLGTCGPKAEGNISPILLFKGNPNKPTEFLKSWKPSGKLFYEMDNSPREIIPYVEKKENQQ